MQTSQSPQQNLLLAALPTAEFERAAVRAKQEVLEREGIGQFLYRQLFDKSPREIEVEALTKQFRNAVELKYETNLKSHELRLQELRSRDHVQNSPPTSWIGGT